MDAVDFCILSFSCYFSLDPIDWGLGILIASICKLLFQSLESFIYLSHRHEVDKLVLNSQTSTGEAYFCTNTLFSIFFF